MKYLTSAILLLMVSLLFYCTKFEKQLDTHKVDILKAQYRGAEDCSMDPVIVVLDTVNYDVTKIGYYHNLMLSYVEQNMGKVAFQDSFHFAKYLDTLIYNGLMEASPGQTHEYGGVI